MSASYAKKGISFSQLASRILSDNNNFWKTVALYFLKKRSIRNTFPFLSKDKIISGETKLVETSNSFFHVQNKVRYTVVFSENSDPILNLVDRYIKIVQVFLQLKTTWNKITIRFVFNIPQKGKCLNISEILTKNNSFQEDDIPVSLIKENRDLFCHFIHHNFNNSLFISESFTDLKKADVIPVHKKG